MKRQDLERHCGTDKTRLKWQLRSIILTAGSGIALVAGLLSQDAQARNNGSPNAVTRPLHQDTQVLPPTIERVGSGNGAVTRHDTTRSGINVRADARFDGSRLDFRASALVDEVRVLAQSAIIDWTTFTPGSEGSQAVFLGSDGRLTFSSALPDYTVLNRIFTPDFDSAVRLDGAITSTAGGGQIGGNVWFYSSGGLIVGQDASINVGSLLLTTNAPDLNAFGQAGQAVALTGSDSGNGTIRVYEGAQITAHNANAYIALVAPRVEQYGTVMADGSIAYVAAEKATLSIDHGLFGISVDVGTSDVNGIVHGDSATSTGLALQGAGPDVTFVAIPKNDAINLLVGGSVGSEPATSASSNNGIITLSTGESSKGNITVQNANLNSFVQLQSAGDADLTANDGEVLDFSSGLSLSVTGDLVIDLDGTGQIVVNGATVLQATDSVFITHTNNTADTVSIDTSTAFTVRANGGDFIASDGTIIDADGTVSLNASDNISFDTITAGNAFSAFAGGNLDFNQASTAEGNILLDAGGDLTGALAMTADANTNVGGADLLNFTAGGILTIGNARAQDGFVLQGNVIEAGNLISDLGGIQANAAVSANVGSLTSLNNSVLNAGSVTLGDADIGGTLTINATNNPDSDLVITGGLNVGNVVSLEATGDIALTAIEAGNLVDLDAGGNITFDTVSTADGNVQFAAVGDIIGTSAMTADIMTNPGGNDALSLQAGGALSIGTARVQDGLTLTGSTVDAGDIASDLGTINVTSTNAATIGGIFTGVNAASVSATRIEVGDIDVGSNLTLNASGGDLDLTGDNDVGSIVDLDASGNITFGTISAGNAFNANAGGDISFTNASTTNGNVTFVAGGDLTGVSAMTAAVTTNLGGNDALSLQAAGALSIDTARAQDNLQLTGSIVDAGSIGSDLGSVNVTSASTATIDSVFSEGSSATVSATRIEISDIDVGSNLTLNASGGDLDLTGDIDVGNVVDLDASGNITFGTISAGNAFNANAGGDITFTNASTTNGNVTFVAGADLIGSSIMTADIMTNLGGNDALTLQAGGTLTIDTARAQDILQLTGSIVDAGLVSSDLVSVVVTATGDADVDTANSAASTSITGANVTLDNADVTGL
ncbi:MAG: hypothetical protein ABJ205_15740, partial [Erythrobacter sp.]